MILISFSRVSFYELTGLISAKVVQKIPFEYYRINHKINDPLAQQFQPQSDAIFGAICEELYE